MCVLNSCEFHTCVCAGNNILHGPGGVLVSIYAFLNMKEQQHYFFSRINSTSGAWVMEKQCPQSKVLCVLRESGVSPLTDFYLEFASVASMLSLWCAVKYMCLKPLYGSFNSVSFPCAQFSIGKMGMTTPTSFVLCTAEKHDVRTEYDYTNRSSLIHLCWPFPSML